MSIDGQLIFITSARNIRQCGHGGHTSQRRRAADQMLEMGIEAGEPVVFISWSEVEILVVRRVVFGVGFSHYRGGHRGCACGKGMGSVTNDTTEFGGGFSYAVSQSGLETTASGSGVKRKMAVTYLVA